MIALALDAATYQGTVAILDGTRILAESSAAMRGRDAERLMPAVGDTLARCGLTLADVDCIVCGSGPGSFTSLRIAASLAKGMALGAAKPLFAVSSLALVVAGNADVDLDDRRFVAVLDALRGECFVGTFQCADGVVEPLGEDRLVSRADVSGIAAGLDATAVGPDLDGGWQPHARGAGLLGKTWSSRGAVDLATWEPTYGRLAEAQVRRDAALRGSVPR